MPQDDVRGGLRAAPSFVSAALRVLAVAWMVALIAAPASAQKMRKVVFIAGTKSHGPGDHEYEKGCRLLAHCLEHAKNLRGYKTEVYLDGWPKDPKTLDDADTIVMYCDGSDHNEADHPLLHGDRLETLGRAMKRGAGLVVLHYTVFVPVKRGGPEFLEWVGGFFDYETGSAPNHWFSKIQAAATVPFPPSPNHPISRGLTPFNLREEYYYNQRFRENDPRRVPILSTELPNETGPQTVAWAVQRKEGGRGFAFTGGHFHSNWQVENFRKMVLNAIVWTAHGEVPKGGVQSELPGNEKPNAEAAPITALILTGHHHPAHDWRATTPALQQVIGRDKRFRFRVLEDPELLNTEDLSGVDLIIQNYNNWERPTLSEAARAKLLSFVRGGKGLALIHFANGAWLDWEDYRKLSRRVWIEGTSTHDAFGPFHVDVRNTGHPISRGIPSFDTIDELYANQQGTLPIEPLVTARSKVTGKDEPLAYAYTEGKGRIFQILLGHDANAIRTPGTSALIRRGAAWVTNREPADLPVETVVANPTAPGRFGSALNGRNGAATAASAPRFQPPLTVECWAKLDSKSGFNILVANNAKESPAHWEIYSYAGSGVFSAYLPGKSPAEIKTDVDICDGKWHYVGMAYEAARIRLYVDGRLAKDQPVATNAGEPQFGPLWFGGYPPHGIGCDGLVDDVRISNSLRELTTVPTEPLKTDAQTIGLWRFDTAEAGRSADESPAHNAALFPMVAVAQTQEPAQPAAPFPKVRAKDSLDWANVANDKGGTRYSPLNQINRDNVKTLQVAWTYKTGDANRSGNTTIECTPLVIEGVMYLTTVRIQVVALDAANGRQIWKYDPKTGGVNRGLAYWSDGKKDGLRRLLLGTPDGRLISLDAKTGRPDPAFGREGIVDLRAGMDRDLSRLNYGVTSAPAIFEDLVYVGIINSEGMPGAPGDIRAFNVRTGKQAWIFHTVPQPGELGHETWEGESWKDRTGVNPWPGFTVDAKRGILFCGTGSAAFDFWGGDRKGQNLFANCTLALDARTGKRIWHFQTLHHDLWDHDVPCPPVLVTVNHDGKKIDAAAQVTKTGYLFLFDRLTGKPLFPIEERPVPASDVPGEQAWSTQPFPLKPPPFSKQTVGVEDLTDLYPEANRDAREQFRKLRGGPAFTPPSMQGTVVIPGFHGGANWSGASFDPTTGILYVNSNNIPDVETIIGVPNNPTIPYTHTGYNRFNDKFGYPAIKPPWGNVTAIDLNKGEIVWQVVHGEYPELAARGVPATGTENFSGTVVTAGGLVFIGGTKDEKMHAYDKATGKLLWDFKLPAGGYATPCTYMVNGKQYVVIAAGGGGKLGTKPGDTYVAFALPERR